MKLHELKCPNCGGILNIKVDGMDYMYCPYCGQQFRVDNENKIYTFKQKVKKDININKNIFHTKRTIDDAEVIRAETEAKEKRNGWIAGLIGLIIWLAAVGYLFIGDDIAKKRADNEGKIQAGEYEDYEGENYEAVVSQFETLGFENITTIDLDDSGIAFWNAGKVDSVSIGGVTEFHSSDYFKPNEKIIIKYH